MPRVEAAMHYLKGLNMLRGRKIMLIAAYSWSEKVLPQMREIVQSGQGTVVYEMRFKMRFGKEEEE